MTFEQFSLYLQKLEGISSRLEITAVLAEVFQKLESVEVEEACYLLQGRLLPAYEGLEFQIAIKTVIKALARVGGETTDATEGNLFGETDFSQQEAAVLKLYHQLGDLGLTAENVIKNGKTQHLSLLDVYQALLKIAQDSGDKSQQRKLHALVQLLGRVEAISAKFIIRIILGRLRLGFSDMTMIDGLSWAMTGSKGEHDILEEAYQKRADIGKLAAFYLQQKDASKRQTALSKYSVELGVPVIPALCQRLNSAAEMIEKMHDVIAEPKYDGLRVQIHVDKKGKTWRYRTFTRNLEETSPMFPELAQAIDDLKCETCILDSEAIGYDPASGELLPFQQTIQRKRKHDVDEKAKEVPVRFYVFDVLALDGQDLLQKPLSERKEKLAALFSDDSTFYHAPELRTNDPQKLHEFHEQNLGEGLEGIVVKQLSSVYQSGRKGWSWVKMKETEGTTGKLADTLDTVVMGYYFGRGKRAQFGIGAVLVGVLDPKSEKVLTIAKIGTGLTEDALRATKKRCDELATTEQPKAYEVNKMLKPDVWCLPGFVIEVAADEITQSPVHSATVALRFPRLVKFRDDKKWDQATSITEVLSAIRQNGE